MKDLVENHGLAGEFYIESAATSTEEIGNGIYPPIKKILESRGIDCNSKHARQITTSDYEKFDFIVCMDKNNLRNIKYIFDDSENKVSLLLDFTNHPHDVADPWYTRDFGTTEREIECGCKALFKHILRGKSNA